MHGIKRVKQTPAALEAKKQRERAKIEEYAALTSHILDLKKSRDYSQDAFGQTTKLLQLNPEFYTIWNYRRHILINGIFPASTPGEINSLLSTDVALTTGALKMHPKVYWIWNHRRWCLENVPDQPQPEDESSIDPDSWRNKYWERELYVVERMLQADARNFHAWDYRRYVLATMASPPTEASELKFTTSKIESNFSNFSAWHQRSKLHTSMWATGVLEEDTTREEEFELVRNAMYTDPNDQSVWMYHRWLIGAGKERSSLEREVVVIQELLEKQPDSKWCMESIVHYKRMLSRLPDTPTVKLLEECAELLRQLETIDPARRARYRDIARELAV